MIQRGLTLLELMVAMAIMALSLTLLYQVDLGALRGVGDHAEHQRATLLAQSLLDSRDAVPAQGLDERGRSAGFEWQVTSRPLPLPPGLSVQTPPLHEVQVRIEWAARQGSKTLAFATLLPQAAPLAPGAPR